MPCRNRYSNKDMKTLLIAVLTFIGLTMFAPHAEARYYRHYSNYRYYPTRYYGHSRYYSQYSPRYYGSSHYYYPRVGYYGGYAPYYRPYYAGYYGGCYPHYYRPGLSLVFHF